jgi:tetratricopeptide (TPR) repeat protein
MLRIGLAEKLIAAKNAAERIHLLKANKKLADGKLALAIKDTCYSAWTSTPVTARKAASALKDLYNFAPQDEIKALFLWVSGISELTKGKLEQAVEALDAASGEFLKLKCGHESAQTQVAKLIALALIGRYTEAVSAGQKILKVLEKYGDELTAGKVEKNLGNILSRQELHHRAEKYYLSACKRFNKIGEKSELIMAENGLAITYTQLNDFGKAGKFFAQALKNACDAKMFLTAAEIEASMGNLALFRGRYDEALKFLELSRRKYEELDMPHQTAVAGLEIAGIYRELNLTDEAFEIYSRTAETLKKLKLQGEEARARAELGKVALLLGKTEFARKELGRSARLYELEKNETGAASVRLEEARLEFGQNNVDRALDIITETEKLLAGSESFRYKLALKLLKANALGQKGKIIRAEKLLVRILAEAKDQEQPNMTLASLNSLGKLAQKIKNKTKAKKYFKQAITLIEKLRAPLAGEEFRMAFLADKLEPFENLASIYLAENKFSEAFLYTERARSRALIESLSNGSKILQPGIPRELKEKLARLREELNWYYSRIDRAADHELAKLQKETKHREKQIAVLMRQIESTRARGKTEDHPGAKAPHFPSKEGSSKEGSFDAAQVRNQLGGKKLLVEFVKVNGVFSAFVVDEKKIRFVKDLAAEEEILSLLKGLQFQFGALRYGAGIPEKFAAELKKRADLYLRKLYERLLRPLESYLDGRDLVIIPAAALYYVPFHALYDGEKYTAEDREVVYAPSAAIWLALQRKPAGKLKKAMLMGFADEAIPLVDREIDELKKIFPDAEVFKGEKATFEAYVKNAPGFDLLHLACHGQFRPENPMFSSLHLAGGWVTVKDICAQKLSAGLVTLSACETGLNKIFAGDEIIGLARGFLSAGVNSLIISLWTVNDAAAAGLMKAFYENLQRGHTAAASIRIAQKEFIARGEHPYFWSPFALIGR